MHAFVTVWPSHLEFRLSDGKSGSEPLAVETKPFHFEDRPDRAAALARFMDVLLMNRVESVEIRYENSED